LLRGAGRSGARDDLAVAVLHEGISALQRSLGIVGCQCQPQAFEIARAALDSRVA